MSKYHFSTDQRLALWHAWNKKCLYCGKPIDWKDLVIDHVLPEKLSDNPKVLEELKLEYGLGNDFSINGYINWLPSHRSCNQNKSDIIYSKSAAIYYIEQAKSKVTKIQQELTKLAHHKSNDKILIELEIGLEKGLLNEYEIQEILTHIRDQKRLNSLETEPIVITFGTNVSRLVNEHILPSEVPSKYASYVIG